MLWTAKQLGDEIHQQRTSHHHIISYVTVHVKKRYKSAKRFFELSPDSAQSTLLPCSFKIWCRSPFHSGAIATFVPGSQTFDIRKTDIFLRGETFQHMRSITHPLKPLTRLWNVEAKKTGSVKVAGKLLASLVTLVHR